MKLDFPVPDAPVMSTCKGVSCDILVYWSQSLSHSITYACLTNVVVLRNLNTEEVSMVMTLPQSTSDESSE